MKIEFGPKLTGLCVGLLFVATATLLLAMDLIQELTPWVLDKCVG